MGTHFYVTDKALHKKGAKVYTCGIDTDISELCELDRYNGESDAIVLVGRVESDKIGELIEAANKGAKVVFLNAEIFRSNENIERLRSVVPDLALTDHRDWLYHKEYILFDRELFEGIDEKLLELARFGTTFPHLAYTTAKTPDYIGCPGILTGYYGVPMGYGLLYALMGFASGLMVNMA